MALEFICSTDIEFGKMIKIPKGANYYVKERDKNYILGSSCSLSILKTSACYNLTLLVEMAHCFFDIRKSKTRSVKKGRNPRINFFKVNPVPTCRMKEIVKGAEYISFNLEGNRFHINYGEPSFYDLNRNKILKREDE